MIENRERAFKQKIKQLEAQIQLLREQLDSERRKGKDFRDRQLTGDILRGGLTSGSYFNRGGISSVGGYIPTDNIDSIGFR